MIDASICVILAINIFHCHSLSLSLKNVTAKLNCFMDTYLSSSASSSTEATHSAAKWLLNDIFMSYLFISIGIPTHDNLDTKNHLFTATRTEVMTHLPK